MSPSSKSIFISYATANGTPHAKRLAADLRALGYTVFVDQESIGGSELFVERLEREILDSACFVAILTREWERSMWVKQEHQLAMRHYKPIFPLLFDSGSFTSGFIGNNQIINFTVGTYDQKFHEFVEQLEHRIATNHKSLDTERHSEWRKMPLTHYGIYAGNNAKVVCVSPDTTIEYAHYMIRDIFEYKIRHLLVTDTGKVGGKLLGVIGLRQILKQEAIKDIEWRKECVHEIMDRKDPDDSKLHFMYVQDTDSIETALQAFGTPLIRDGGVPHWFYMSALPIADSQGHAVGIIGFKDVLRHFKKGGLPMPQVNVSDYMISHSQIHCATENETIIHAKNQMLPYAQRDLPVLESMRERRLRGLIPDHILIINQVDKRVIKDVPITPPSRLRNQTPSTSIEKMLDEYVSSDESKNYYSVPVIKNEHDEYPIFEGLIGYRDVFRAMLETC